MSPLLQPSQEQTALTAFLPQAQLPPAGAAALCEHAAMAMAHTEIKKTLRIIDFPFVVFHDATGRCNNSIFGRRLSVRKGLLWNDVAQSV